MWKRRRSKRSQKETKSPTRHSKNNRPDNHIATISDPPYPYLPTEALTTISYQAANREAQKQAAKKKKEEDKARLLALEEQKQKEVKIEGGLA